MQKALFVGYDVHGRNGSLGIVVGSHDAWEIHSPADSELVVMGGRSSLLRIHIPLSHIAAVSHETETLEIDLDVVDFSPSIAGDGLVDLRVIR